MGMVYVISQELKVLGVIDEFVSLIWRPAYYDVGDFELYISATDKAVELLQADRYLVRASDVSVDANGKTVCKNPMIIKNLWLTTDVENGDYFTVTGRELKYLLHQRIIWTQTNLTGTAESGIRRLVTENAIEPSDTNRVIPNLVLGELAGLTDTIVKQITGAYLDEAIKEICTTYNYGWELYIYDGELVFNVFAGVDRSYGQSGRPYVIFSEDFDNILNSEYQLSSEAYANTALVAGEGEGLERIRAEVGSDNAGLERYETYVDSRDISQNKDSENEIVLEDYLELLKTRGLETLATLNITEGFGGEVLHNVTFKYNVDYYLGDIVTVVNKYGIGKDVRVLSAIESEDATGVKLLPQFNI